MTDTKSIIETDNIKDCNNIPINTNIKDEIPFDEAMVWKVTKIDSTEDKNKQQNFVSFGDVDDDDCENFESFVPAFLAKSEV